MSASTHRAQPQRPHELRHRGTDDQREPIKPIGLPTGAPSPKGAEGQGETLLRAAGVVARARERVAATGHRARGLTQGCHLPRAAASADRRVA